MRHGNRQHLTKPLDVCLLSNGFIRQWPSIYREIGISKSGEPFGRLGDRATAKYRHGPVTILFTGAKGDAAKVFLDGELAKYESWNKCLNKTIKALFTETVKAAKEFLDGELAKYKTWKDAKKSDLMNLLALNTENEYQSLRTRGVGQTTLLKFLGGNWKQWKIQAALQNLACFPLSFLRLGDVVVAGLRSDRS